MAVVAPPPPRACHRAPASLQVPQKGKLKPRFYGPYRITAIINEVAYRLELPPHARLHDVIHVGLLKKFVGLPPTTPPALLPTSNGAAVLELERATRARLARGVCQILVQWKGEPAASATWEDVDSFLDLYPSFQLEDELPVQGQMSCGGASTSIAHVCVRRFKQKQSRRQKQNRPIKMERFRRVSLFSLLADQVPI